MSEKKEHNSSQSHPDPSPVDAASTTSPGPAPAEIDSPKIVYRRGEVPGTTPNASIPNSERSVWRREISPAIVPLVVGFLLLLILIGWVATLV